MYGKPLKGHLGTYPVLTAAENRLQAILSNKMSLLQIYIQD